MLHYVSVVEIPKCIYGTYPTPKNKSSLLLLPIHEGNSIPSEISVLVMAISLLFLSSSDN